MQIATEQYKGFTIAVTPLKDNDDLWDFEYRISKLGQGGQDSDPGATITRTRTLGGHATAEVACLSGLQVARTEVDNLVALTGATP